MTGNAIGRKDFLENSLSAVWEIFSLFVVDVGWYGGLNFNFDPVGYVVGSNGCSVYQKDGSNLWKWNYLFGKARFQ
ncbi:hypothetical protein TNCT_515671 [Trichonephila clavata]|uniref:Uncharacterized protein n=1 Tax=Trichonephila clavata TaxID=2740835 RepID=A0A8X6HKH8_TRICU|nr:hypothetical protein TNCT_515671 [Trichonephila clavata]